MTRQTALIALLCSIAFVTGSQLIIKARFAALDIADQLGSDPVSTFWLALRDMMLLGGILLLFAGAVLWYVALSRLPLGLMMPIAAMIMPLVVIGSAIFLGEILTGQKGMAIAVITAGTLWLCYLHQV